MHYRIRSLLLIVLWGLFPFLAIAHVDDGTTDSFTQECPLIKKYETIFKDSDGLQQVKSEISQRLSLLGLSPIYSSSLADSFGDSSDDLIRLKRLASIVVPSLEKYSSDWFRIAGLEKISFVKNLNVAGTIRKAMPDPANNTMVYADNNDLICLAGMEERVHHEFYHFIEAKFHGDMYYRDPIWMQWNTSGFEYGTGGAAAYGIPNWQNLGHPAEALVSRYAAFAPEEDKAEMFGWLMTEGYASRLASWTQQDTLLFSKRAYLINFFQTVSSGLMDESYFVSFTR